MTSETSSKASEDLERERPGCIGRW
jgi:hypothetical protein